MLVNCVGSMNPQENLRKNGGVNVKLRESERNGQLQAELSVTI